MHPSECASGKVFGSELIIVWLGSADSQFDH